jgi:hypothetical protein
LLLFDFDHYNNDYATMTTELPLIPPYFIYGAASSIAVYYCSYWIGESVLIPRFGSSTLQKKLASLNEKKYINFVTTIPSTFHAVIQCIGFPVHLALGYSEAHNLNKIVHYDEYWPAYYQGFFAGYMVADFLKSGLDNLGPAFTTHHVAAVLAWTYSAYLRSMQWQTTLLQFCEFSTPFMNARQLLIMAGYDTNGSVMTWVNFLFFLSFGAVRVAPLPKILSHWVSDGYSDMKEKDGFVPAAIGTSFTVIHTCLQTMWFAMMIRKLMEVIRGRDAGDDQKKKIERKIE